MRNVGLEVVQLRIPDIDSSRMVLRIVNGKGNKDRYVPLSERLLEMLRQYWKEYRPPEWLFPGQDPEKRLSRRSVSAIFLKARLAAGIKKPATAHTLRHSYATCHDPPGLAGKFDKSPSGAGRRFCPV